MKINKIFFFAMLVLALVGCDDEFGTGSTNTPASVGDEIQFGGSMTFERGATRVVYGDENSDHTATEIKWYQGDAVRIYCEQARDVNGLNYCDYKVQEYVQAPVYDTNGTLTNPDESKVKDGNFEDLDDTSLKPAADEPYGLQWGSDGEHVFYGAYPSRDMFAEGSSVANAYKLERNMFTGYLPSSQSPSSYQAGVKKADNNYTTYTIQPAMRFAYMMAKSVASPADGYCSLQFQPVVTAVEFTLINNAYTTENVDGTVTEEPIEDISLVQISSVDGSFLCGSFTTDIDNMSTKIVSGETSITIPVQDDKGNPVTLAPHDTLRFTVFMLPNDGVKDVNLDKLKITVQTGFLFKSATLTSKQDMLVYAKKRNFIAGINLKWDKKFEGVANFLSLLNDDMLVGNLSLIGAGGTGSHTMPEGYNQQTLDIDGLWDRGVRCFEVFTDMAGSTSASLGDQYLVCNGKKSTSIRLSDVVTALQKKLEENPKDFVILVLGYQQSDGTTYRDAKNWQSPLKNYWENTVNTWRKETDVTLSNGDKIVCEAATYSPDLTLGKCRGKLFCISRPTTVGRDQWWYSMYDVAKNVVPVLGWGPSPDAWYARGYTRIDRPYYINQTGDFDGIANTTPTVGGSNYMFPSYLNVLEASVAGGALNSSGSSETSSSFVKHLEWETPATYDDKFMYRVCSHDLYGGAHTYTILREYDDLRVYAQDWRRVANGAFNSSNPNITPSYKVYIKNALTNSTSYTITSASLTYNNSEHTLSTTTVDGTTYYYYDFGSEVTASYTIEFNYKTSSYGSSTRSGTITIADDLESDTYYQITRSGYSNNYTYSYSKINNSGSSSSSQYCYYWPSSIDEKKNDILTALDRSMHADDRAYTIYVNSLCGYYIDSKYEKSYKPDPMRLTFIPSSSGTSGGYVFNDTKYNGTAYDGVSYSDYYTSDSNPGAYDMYGGTQGDIVTFAKDMNQFFYEELVEIGAQNLAGPTGIIMMDRVSNDPSDPGYYLPQIIVSNNFKWNTASGNGSKSMSLNDVPNEEAQFAPANRDIKKASGKMGIVWE